ncbi:NrfD/PsrC family molybdoenzyme membrane anchor subunit [Acetonema longum]|uniref:Polysulphide reductase NrfD n=1 Tax=Acetonema longum DSM 6540 TaxID=1009370 RepID=F7NPJ7_9FIRM|nr:NrfD/PsrC family molybdoenzyme membrane anchor subunit [Acetonema longum]EGO62037.1 polysulphide reductase NrfD [Acetonema longum DSM 6540]
MELHWHWLVVIYLFLGGLGAGAYITSFLAEKGFLGKAPSLTRAGYFIATPAVAIGTLMLVFDLGQGFWKPWLMIGLLSNFTSVMSWGVYILSAFILAGFLKCYFAFKNKKAPELLTWAGAFLALCTAAYTGFLISVIKAIPFWNSNIIPVLFVVSALSTGLSATSLLAPLLEKGTYHEGRANQLHLLLVVVEIIVAASFIMVMLNGSNGPIGTESAKLLISGKYQIVFWGLFIVLGLVLPAFIYLQQILSQIKKTGDIPQNITANDVGSAVLAEAAASSKIYGAHSPLMIIGDTGVIIGGFALRMLIVFAALPVWDGFSIY